MIKIRYTKQGDLYSCGPAAIANAIKWSGENFNWKAKKQEFIKEFKVPNMRPNGTPEKPMREMIKKHFPKSKRGHPKLGPIENHLRNGGAIIAALKGKSFYHYTLIISVSEDGQNFKVVNMYKTGPAVQDMPRKILRDSMRRKVVRPWFLK